MFSEVHWILVQWRKLGGDLWRWSSKLNSVSLDAYKRLGSSKKLMCPKTFCNWFWCWASHQGREFRKACFPCGDKVEFFVSDGTIIHVNPIYHTSFFIFFCFE